jgi:hypothetical protein
MLSSAESLVSAADLGESDRDRDGVDTFVTSLPDPNLEKPFRFDDVFAPVCMVSPTLSTMP